VLTFGSQINGIVIEFHDVDLLWPKFQGIMTDLSRQFVVTHIHGNNAGELFPNANIPRSLEITLLKKDLISEPERQSKEEVTYPIKGLDAPNMPGRPDFVLNFG
jgi:hypothetical protein